MKTSEAFPAKFLKADDLQGHSVTVVIDRYEIAKLPDGQRKPALYFRGKQRGMILNRANSNTIEFDCGYGEDMDAWIGKPIILFSAMVDFQGKRVPGLRVRKPGPTKERIPVPSHPDPEPGYDDGLDDRIPF